MTSHRDPVQFASVQKLRGVAALLVVAVHAINVNDFLSYPEHGGMARGWLATHLALNEFGATGVDLFFVISGFVMALVLERWEGPRIAAFLLNRFDRVVPLFWLMSALYGVLLFSLGLPTRAEAVRNSLLILPVMDYGHYDAPLLIVGWSLGFELAFYGLVALSIWGRHRLAMVAALVIATSIVGCLPILPIGIMSVLFNPIQLEFALGIGVYVIHRNWKARPTDGWVAPALIGLGAALLLKTVLLGFPFQTPHLPLVKGETGLVRTLIWGLPWAMIVLGLVLREKAKVSDSPARPSPWMMLGNASYSLYLSHMLVFTAAEQRWPVGLVSPDVMILVLIASATAFGLLCHQRLERPLLAWIRRLRAKSAIATASAAQVAH